MKKVIFFSFFIVTLSSLSSNAVDLISGNTTIENTHTNDTGGQSGTINPPRP